MRVHHPHLRTFAPVLTCTVHLTAPASEGSAWPAAGASPESRARSLRDTSPQANPWCRYGGEHKAPELQKEVVYGLTELHREDIK